jgi:cell division septal protein FtsQ
MQIDVYGSERSKKRRRERRNFFVAIAAILAIGVLSGIGWIIFRSPLLRVNHIVVQGNLTVSSDSVIALFQSAATRDHGFWGSHLDLGNMFAWPAGLSPSDLTALPSVKSAVIEKNYFNNTVTIDVTERQPLSIWCAMKEDGKCYWFDDEGVAFKDAFDTEGGRLFAIHDYSDDEVGLGEKILPDRFIPGLVSVINVMQKSGLGVREAALTDLSLEEIDISTYNGPALYFSLRFSATSTLDVIKNLMGQSSFSKLQYIDCRTENRVYYK